MNTDFTDSCGQLNCQRFHALNRKSLCPLKPGSRAVWFLTYISETQKKTKTNKKNISYYITFFKIFVILP